MEAVPVSNAAVSMHSPPHVAFATTSSTISFRDRRTRMASEVEPGSLSNH